MTQRENFAFETTLGGKSVTQRIQQACASHDVLIWFVGLDRVELHIERVALRVAHGGHSIPEAKIRARYLSAIANLAQLVQHVQAIQLYDNSRTVSPGQRLQPPRQLAVIVAGRLRYPQLDELDQIPNWAKPVLEVALAGAAR